MTRRTLNNIGADDSAMLLIDFIYCLVVIIAVQPPVMENVRVAVGRQILKVA